MNFIIVGVIIVIVFLIFLVLVSSVGSTQKGISSREKILKQFAQNNDAKMNFLNHEKGVAYEFLVGEYYKELGYLVKLNGIEKGANDGGIDIIAKKTTPIDEQTNKTETILIQCKNYVDTSMLDQDMVRKFLGDCYVYLYSKRALRNKNNTFKHIFCISNNLNANNNIWRYEKFCKKHRGFDLEIQIMQYDETQISTNDNLKCILEKYVYPQYLQEKEA